MSPDPVNLFQAAQSGDRRALARLLSIVEDRRPGWMEVLAAADASDAAHRIGVTGAPGAGKSTLTDRLIQAARSEERTVAVVAVDPSSPFTGGAILGDRVRMQNHIEDPGVMIRSMASRGHMGGLSAAAPRVVTVMGACGFDVVIVETVGVGQDEVEIVELADSTVVVVNPGWGDAIQAAKAGIMEIGDVFVVNKADRPGSDETVADLKHMLSLSPVLPWSPPVRTTVATTGEGVADLWTVLMNHRAHLEGSEAGRAAKQRRRRHALLLAVQDDLRRRAEELIERESDLVGRVASGEVDPWTAASRLTER